MTISLSALARLLGLHRGTTKRHIRDGAIPPPDAGPSRWQASTIARWCDAGRPPSPGSRAEKNWEWFKTAIWRLAFEKAWAERD